MSKSWEEAFGQVDKEVDEFKLKQRKIQQRDWEKELKYVNDDMTMEEHIADFLRDNGFDTTDIFETIKKIVNDNAILRERIASIRNIIT